jgi:glucosamine-6-phosphate deaminase
MSNQKELIYNTARVQIHGSIAALGTAAAQRAAQLIHQAIADNGHARIMVATGNSQIAFIDALTRQPIDWNRVEVFHMDEYSGISETHPASFRRWIKTRLENKVHPHQMHYIRGDAPDLNEEIQRYSTLLEVAPVDVAFVGFGENGHIAFNDPPTADFNDPLTVKRVQLDEPCRRQQAGEGHFKDLAAVPLEAITVTCPGLFRARAWVSCVPEARKAKAVQSALEGPISIACPASLIRRHPDARLYLDTDSAALLSAPNAAGSSAN